MTDMAQADRTLRSNLTLFYRTAALQRLERQNHELLAALQSTVAALERLLPPDRETLAWLAVADARTAIAKATGGDA